MKHPILPGQKIGKGVGSVLLQRGGPGVASSYPSLSSYVQTTGRNPYKESTEFQKPTSKGFGVGLKSKIKALMPKPTRERKPANINFSL